MTGHIILTFVPDYMAEAGQRRGTETASGLPDLGRRAHMPIRGRHGIAAITQPTVPTSTLIFFAFRAAEMALILLPLHFDFPGFSRHTAPSLPYPFSFRLAAMRPIWR